MTAYFNFRVELERRELLERVHRPCSPVARPAVRADESSWDLESGGRRPGEVRALRLVLLDGLYGVARGRSRSSENKEDPRGLLIVKEFS